MGNCPGLTKIVEKKMPEPWSDKSEHHPECIKCPTGYWVGCCRAGATPEMLVCTRMMESEGFFFRELSRCNLCHGGGTSGRQKGGEIKVWDADKNLLSDKKDI